ncbi:pentapeptide repeat-containing protein [Streptomyces sp. NPDC058308]|uniref:pentapeptide repeat-containing protein n=1 Tax=Streptomyces sp. NPDC058308 TaxID=3346440 RepID=UPI0036E77145
MDRSYDWRPRALRYALTVLISLGTCLLLLGPVSWLLAGDTVRDLPVRQRPQALDEVRRTVLTVATTIAGLAGLGYTIRTYYLSRRGQVTDRYGKAVAQLASANLMERLGGVYSLEHVMRESEQDHETVVGVLAAFVRTESPVRRDRAATSAVREDVAAAVTVLARRPAHVEKNRIDLRNTDLTGLELLPDQDGNRPRLRWADLCGAWLTGARMPGADLRDAWLGGADLTRADLTGADLTGAWLSKATARETVLTRATLVTTRLDETVLEHTHFEEAVLTESWFNHAKPDHACFSGADLTLAWLRDVNLANSQGLVLDQVLAACFLARSTPPTGMAGHPSILARQRELQNSPQRHLGDHPFPWPVRRTERGSSRSRRRRAQT